MTEYKMIAVESKVFEAISALAQETHRTKGGMVKEMFDQYLKNIPVVGKIENGIVVKYEEE